MDEMNESTNHDTLHVKVFFALTGRCRYVEQRVEDNYCGHGLLNNAETAVELHVC